MPNTPDEAIDYCSRQSKNGPQFGVGLCKRMCRTAYAVPSDGSRSAAEAWTRTDQRLNVAGSLAPRGALLWWTGGSGDYGHVAIADGKGGAWSTDILRPGFFDHVPFAEFGKRWPSLRWAGVSRDIDGVTVVPVPATEKPIVPVLLPTIDDCMVTLERFASRSSNPAAKGLYLSARRVIAPLSNGRRAKVPETIARVVEVLEERRRMTSSASSKARLTAAINLLRPVK